MGPGAATLEIIGRRMKKSSSGTHEHVGWVLLSDRKTKLSRKQVLGLMELGVAFETRAKNGDSARLTSYECGRCGKTYLRTDADRSKPDDLDELGLF